MGFSIDDDNDLTDEEVEYLQERISMLFHDKEDMDAETCLMLAYIQGMVECLVSVCKPDAQQYRGAQVLLELAKRAGGVIGNAIDREQGPDPKRN